MTGDAIMATIFGLLGCAGVLFTVFRSAKAQREIPRPKRSTPSGGR